MLRVLAAMLFMLFAGSALAERRVALVIGEDGYKTIRKLDNAVDDAKSVEDTLEQLGFEVTLETNRDLKRVRRALDDFREDGAGADVALVYFAGHGVEISGDNRLLPIDADASSLDALKASTLPLEEVRAGGERRSRRPASSSSTPAATIRSARQAMRPRRAMTGAASSPSRRTRTSSPGSAASAAPKASCSPSPRRPAKPRPTAPTGIRPSPKRWSDISAPKASRCARR